MANVVNDLGRGQFVKYLAGVTAIPANFYGSWGTGAGTAAKADTTLFTEATETRVATTRTSQTTDTIVRHVWTLVCNATGKTVTNAGVFDALTTGVLICKGDFTGVPLVAGDQITFTADITFTNA